MVGNWQIFIQSGKLNCCHHRAAGRGDTRASRVLSKLLNEIRSYISYTFDVICELQHSTCFILIWSYSRRPFQITFVARQNSFFFSFKFHFHGRATSQYFFNSSNFQAELLMFSIFYITFLLSCWHLPQLTELYQSWLRWDRRVTRLPVSSWF